MKTKGRYRTAWFSIVILGFLCAPAATQGTKSVKVDYGKERPLVASFEKEIGKAISEVFPGSFGQVQPPKGAHLPGYGYTFMFVINIRRGMLSTPFGSYANESEISPDQKRQKIEALKDKLVPLLFTHGSRLMSLQKNETVSICALFEETNAFKPEENLNTTLVLSAQKSDLDELATKQERFNELRQKVKIVEY